MLKSTFNPNHFTLLNPIASILTVPLYHDMTSDRISSFTFLCSLVLCSLCSNFFFYLLQEVRGQSEENVKEVSSCPSHEAPIRVQSRAGQGGGPGLYKVVKTGPSGHNIRSCPNLRGIPIGMLVLGNMVKAIGEVRSHPK